MLPRGVQLGQRAPTVQECILRARMIPGRACRPRYWTVLLRYPLAEARPSRGRTQAQSSAAPHRLHLLPTPL